MTASKYEEIQFFVISRKNNFPINIVILLLMKAALIEVSESALQVHQGVARAAAGRLADFPEKGKVVSNWPSEQGSRNFVPFRSIYGSYCGNTRTLP